MVTSCLCGAVRVEAPTPEFVHECNCTLCRKTGARWGYYHPRDVRVTGETLGYVRGDKPGAGASVRRCATCGSVTHFTLTPEMVEKHGDTMLGVNVRLADPGALAGVELRYPDGAAWDGAGAFGYVRESVVLAG